MRDMLIKNLTSSSRKRKVISSSEVFDRDGVHNVIRRHFIYLVREVQGQEMENPLSCLYVVKEKSTKELREKFFCRIKGSIYTIVDNRLFLIVYMHSLKINIEALAHNAQ